jgi:hypothetical protein
MIEETIAEVLKPLSSKVWFFNVAVFLDPYTVINILVNKNKNNGMMANFILVFGITLL